MAERWQRCIGQRRGWSFSLWIVVSLLFSPLSVVPLRASAPAAPERPASALAPGRMSAQTGAAALSAGPTVTETATLAPNLPTDPAPVVSATATKGQILEFAQWRDEEYNLPNLASDFFQATP